jgi:hypothetical protein
MRCGSGAGKLSGRISEVLATINKQWQNRPNQHFRMTFMKVANLGEADGQQEGEVTAIFRVSGGEWTNSTMHSLI